jgi:5-methylcytosine-specific restriction enzyme A
LVYGEIGSGFIECHHNKPISELTGEQKSKLSDLSIVCSNCHKMIHRSKPLLVVDELKKSFDEGVSYKDFKMDSED